MNQSGRGVVEKRRIKIPHMRWVIILSVFFVTALNYIDRMTLGLSANHIMTEFGMTKSHFGLLVGGFMWTYMFSQALGGIFVDRVGVRLGLGLAVLWWSIATAAGGLAGIFPFVGGFAFLLTCRIALGAAEGVNWPAGVKIASEWFPVRERAFATSVFNTGSTVGATIATVLIAWLIAQFGWRWAFGSVGLLGILFGIYWLLLYRKPNEHPFVTEKELAYITEGRDTTRAGHVKPFTREWFAYLKKRDVLALCLIRFFEDPIWWFYTNWIAVFLAEKYQVNILTIGVLWMVPMIAADLGNLTGGAVSSILYAKFGKSLNFARKSVMIASLWTMMLGLFAVLTDNIYISVFFMSISCFCHSSYAAVILTIPADVFDHRYVASISGLTGFSAGLGGALAMWLIGIVWDNFGVLPVFMWAAIMPVAASMIVIFFLGKLKEREE